MAIFINHGGSMANRINISVPDELMDDLNKYKDQLPEKVSAVCQKALSKQINELKDNEKYQKQLLQNPKIIEKIETLKMEREDLKKNIIELGKQDGTEFITVISYSELLDMKSMLTNYTLKKLYSKNHHSSFYKDLLITISSSLKNNFDKNELNEFLLEVQEDKYISTPYGQEENEYYDEQGDMAATIIAKYLSKNFPQIKPKSEKTVFVFNKLYIGAFFEALKNFYEVAKDQTELYEE